MGNNTFSRVLHSYFLTNRFTVIMNNIFRGLIAGYGAKKLGGGCFGTVLVFIIIWVLLGYCN